MRAFAAIIAGCVALACAANARADVISARPDGFLIQSETVAAASPEPAWRALLRIGAWWDSAHTYSGDARNMQLEQRAGGCWCERWGRNQSVEHGRVVMLLEQDGARTLRILGGLGPLQESGASAVLTLTVSPHPDGAKIGLTYRVAGDGEFGLDQAAPAVDRVLAEQMARLARYAATGAAE